MLIYIVIYGIVFSTMFLDNGRLSNNNKKIILIFNVTLLTLFFGLRWETGTDWEQYFSIFDEVRWDNWWNMDRGVRNRDLTVDPGFAFINILLKTICFNSYTCFLLVTNLLRWLVIMYIVLKYSKYPIVSFCAFVSMNYYFPTRNPYAIAICLLSIDYIFRRNLKCFLLIVFSASMIHLSAICFIPAYYLLNLRIKTRYLYVFFFLSVVFSASLSILIGKLVPLLSILSPKLGVMAEIYTNLELDTELGNTRGILSYLLALFWISLFVNCNKTYCYKTNNLVLKNENNVSFVSKYNFYLLCYILSVCVYNIFSGNLHHFNRFAAFYDLSFLLIPYVIDNYKKIRLLIIIILVTYFYYRLYSSVFNGSWPDLFIPYKSIFI